MSDLYRLANRNYQFLPAIPKQNLRHELLDLQYNSEESQAGTKQAPNPHLTQT
jgi:hypothetical protein